MSREIDLLKKANRDVFILSEEKGTLIKNLDEVFLICYIVVDFIEGKRRVIGLRPEATRETKRNCCSLK